MTWAGYTTSGFTDGVGSVARFNNPVGLAIDSTGIVFVTDFNNQAIRMIDSTGNKKAFHFIDT